LPSARTICGVDNLELRRHVLALRLFLQGVDGIEHDNAFHGCNTANARRESQLCNRNYTTRNFKPVRTAEVSIADKLVQQRLT
jgi:hypothetical protein